MLYINRKILVYCFCLFYLTNVTNETGNVSSNGSEYKVHKKGLQESITSKQVFLSFTCTFTCTGSAESQLLLKTGL